MVDTARSTGDLLALFADNASGDISAQDGRDVIKSFGNGYRDVAAGRVPTFSDSPNASFPGTTLINGASVVAMLTTPEYTDFSSIFASHHSTGWRAVDIASSTLTATIDFGASTKAEVVQGILSGIISTGDQIYHPSAVKFEYSDDNSSYSNFGTPLTSMDDNALDTRAWACLIEAAPVAARYWRLSVDEPSPGAGDNWIMLRRWRLVGRLI